jgi:hypothetical protein
LVARVSGVTRVTGLVSGVTSLFGWVTALVA